MEHFQNVVRGGNTPVVRVSDKERMSFYKDINEDCFFEYDMIHDILWISRNAKMFGEYETKISSFSEKIRRIERVYEEDIDKLLVFLTEGNRKKMEFRYIKEDGSVIWCEARGAIIEDPEGKIKSMLGVIADIDQEKRMYQMLAEQSLLDPLTKLYSKSKAQSLIESYLRNEGSFGKHVLVLLNIRAFSEINKRFGKVFGDGVLVNIAEKLRKEFRRKDIVARVGGDDFLILMKDVRHQEIVHRKINQVAEMIQNIYGGDDLYVSCSIGAACFPSDGRNYGSLFRNADSAMYRAKKSGTQVFEMYDASYQMGDFGKQGEFYHDYSIKEKAKGTEGNFEQEIMEFAIDVMLDSKEVSSAIKLILDKVGKYYKCDVVSVLETDDNDILHTTYSWNGKEGLNYFSSMRFIDLKELPAMSDYFDERGLRFFSNTSLMKKHPGFSGFIEMFGAKALLQCAFYDEGEFRGCVCIGYEKTTHEWLKEEVSALHTITKLLSVYLLKLKASEKIKKRIENIQNYDALTKLPTQQRFRMNVEQEIAKSPESKYAIVCFDINKFKYINDALGYEVGDDLLKEIVRTASTGSYDIVMMGRVAADNFLLLMTYINKEQIEENLKRLNESFAAKIKFCNVGKSVYIVSGVAVVSAGQNVISAIDNANIARKNMKKKSEMGCCFYDEKLQELVNLEMDISNSMQQALEEQEFSMYLQPKVDLVNRNIVGAEALTRWIRRDGRIMMPEQFIPLFEKNGFIVQLDFYIYERACKLIKKWMDHGIEPVAISVNVSRVHLNVDDFSDKVIALVDKYRIPYQYLEFELTESMFLDNTQSAIDTMNKLREVGFMVAIDDFGAGFSSLNLLKDMASDVLKLDKEFFSRGDMKMEEKIIVSNITNMAKQLKMKVLSEGVETEEQSEFLKEISCDMAQGYLFAKPMPEEEFTKLLKLNRLSV